MKILMVLPLLISFLGIVLSLLAWSSLRLQRVISVAGTLGLLGAALALLAEVQRSGILSLQVGNWPAPFGITLVADLFSVIMLVIIALLSLMTAVFSLAGIDDRRAAHGYYPLFFALLLGGCGAFLTGDIFNLYVWFEVMLMASFVLMALGGERAQLEGAIKYFVINLMYSALFLSATGILYGLSGTLNMADLSVQLGTISESGLVTTIAILYLAAFGIKSAIFPLFFWLPASYHTPPVTITALFSGLLTKAGVYGMIRVFTLLFLSDTAFTHSVILILAGFTMVTGVLGAAAQVDLRRLLSFHIISQIGYLLMGLGLFIPASLASAIFFMAHVIFAKSALFLVGGIIERLSGSFDLRKLGGLYRSQPLLAVLFLLPALSLAGLPPLSGFFGKLALVRAGLEIQQYLIVAVSLFVSLLTLYSMTKVWNEAFWKPAPAVRLTPTSLTVAESWAMLIPAGALALLSVAIGLFAEPVYALASQAAEQLMNPALYVQVVLGRAP